jgi:hypothetical protein
LPDGRIVVDAHITRAGIFEYSDPAFPGGIRRELRPESEVFDSASIDSYSNLPATHGHPTKNGQRIMLTADTAKPYMVGATGDQATRDDNHVRAKVMIADAPTIKRMDDGDVEVSCGYSCWVDETPGIDPKYGRYDAIQRHIRGNHLAVAVGLARAGRTARVRMDSELTAEERNALANKSFADPKTHQEPIENADHVRAAMARFEGTHYPTPAEKKTAFGRIVAAAKKFGVDSIGFVAKHRTDDMMDMSGGDNEEPPSLTVMTTAVDGHQHTLDPTDPSGCTSYATAEGAMETHRHEWVRGMDGTITIAENAGHSHAIDPATIGMRADALRPTQFGVGGSAMSAGRYDAASHVGGAMDPEKMKETIRVLQADLTATKTEAVKEKERADSAETARDIERGRIATLEGDMAQLRIQIAAGASAVETAAVLREKTRADSLQEQVNRFDEIREKELRARTSVMLDGALVCGSDFRMDDLSVGDIRRAIVKRLDSTADIGKDVPDGVITGRCQQLVEGFKRNARSHAAISIALGAQQHANQEQVRTDSKEQRLKEFRSQGLKPLANDIRARKEG